MTATYDYQVPHGELTPDELTEMLGPFPLERAGARTLEQITEAHIQRLLARLEVLTTMLREAKPNETTHLASRIALLDLAAVADQFRGKANRIRVELAKVLADLREA